MEQKIPYKIYLAENEIPTQWYNVRADMKVKPAPLISPADGHALTLEEMNPIFCEELNKQELDNDTAYFDIPKPVQEFYRMYRPSPLVRAYFLEKALGTPAKIYYKFEGNNTSGSHKLNSSIAQAYYAKAQGLKGVTTETGAGQWGTALSMACSYFDLDCKVFMVKVSYEQKPFRREVMRTYGANVTPSPSMTTEVGRKILANHPGTTGSLGCAISEAVETAVKTPGYRYVLGSVLNQVLLHQSIILGSVLNQVLLHQSIIGLEVKKALDKYNIKPDILIGCLGGGSNFGGFASPFFGEILRGEANYHLIGVEPASCPSFTRGKFAYDFCDTGMICPLAKMYTLGSQFIPSANHAGGLRFHGISPILAVSTASAPSSHNSITMDISRHVPSSRLLSSRLPNSSPALRVFCLLPSRATPSALPSTRPTSANSPARRRPSSSTFRAPVTSTSWLTSSSTME